MLFETRNLIAGEFVPAQSSKTLERLDPLTKTPATLVPDSDVLDVVRAIQAANKAWTSWNRVDSAARAQHCRAIADELEKRKADIAQSVSFETGATLRRSEQSAARTIETFRFLAQAVTEPPTTEETRDSLFLQSRLAIGLVAVISPVDEPLFTLGSRVAAALAAGNVVIAKPSSYAPRTAHLFAECVQAAGLPAGVFNLVQGRGERVGRAIAQHPGVSTLSLAGRTETGRDLHVAAAEFLKRTQLSLSSCNSALIFDGVDLERTSGEVARLCLSSDIPWALKAQRIFVQESVYKSFLEVFRAQIERLAMGDPRSSATQLGPLPRPEDATRFQKAIEQAVGERGKLLIGGSEPLAGEFAAGNFVRPTVIYDLHLCSTLQQEEIPGPLALVESVKYPHDAIRHTNTSPLGGAAYVFHPKAEAAQKIAERIEAGRVIVNTSDEPWSVQQPHGGLKMSGLGREGGLELLMFFSRQSRIAMPRSERS